MAAVLVCVSLLVAVLPATAVGADPDHRSSAAPERSRTSPTLVMRSLTGVRDGATTVLGGVVLNDGPDAVDADVVVEDLPSGVSISMVRPDPASGEDGLAWRCGSASCRLIDAAGTPTQLPAGSDTGLTIALAGELPKEGGSVRIRVGSSTPVEVALDREDGAAPLAASAISVAPSGTPVLEPGSTVESTVTVGNLAADPIDPGSLTLVRSGGPAGAGATMSGDGWVCDGPRCTWSGSVAAFATTAPLSVRTTAAVEATDASAPVGFSAAATVAGQALSAVTDTEVRIAAPTPRAVSVQLQLPHNSFSAPATATAQVRVVPTGNGTLRTPVRVRLELPEGIRADWSSVDAASPWTCSAAERSCSSTGPLTGGVPQVLSVPLEITTDTSQGVAHLEAFAALLDERGDVMGTEDRAGAGLVVTSPPVAELRSTLRAAGATAPVRGEPIEFPADVERDLVVTVENQGSRSARAGSTVDVELYADTVQRLESAGEGDEPWRCSTAEEIDRDGPLRCHLTLADDLASGDDVELPVRLPPAPAGSSRWTVRSGADGDVPASSARTFRVDVGAVSPSLSPHVRVLTELERGEAGTVEITLRNRGDGVARGGVLLVDLPAGLRPESVDGEQWACDDATLRAARGSLSCTVDDDVEPDGESSPLRLELAADTPADHVSMWTWASAPGQLARDRAGVTTRLDVNDPTRVDAGPDLTVVTPVRGADGVERPAVVELHGSVPAGDVDVRWEQLCTERAAKGCDRVDPAVAWLDVAEGETPNRPLARFVAPAVREATTLRFRLDATRDGRERTDEVAVRLVPARIAAVGDGAERNATDSAADGSSASGSSATTDAASGPSRGGPTDQVDVSIGDGSVLQVATRTAAVLSARATGTAPFSYTWTQTGGPSARIGGGTDGAQLVLTAPDLDPDQTSEELEFRVEVTDADGHSASATATVQVVWGDDGLQVELADGASSVVATVDTPLSISSAVTSAGAPYTYDWSLDGDVDPPSGTPVDDAVLTFTAPDQPGTATAQLKVTDSFGRVTVESVRLSITELPAGQVPAALCSALGDLQTGTDVSLSGPGTAVTLPAAGAQVDGDAAPRPTTTTTGVAPSSTTSSTTVPSTSTPSSTTTPSASTSAPSTSSTTTPTSSTTTSSSTTTTTTPSCPSTAYATFRAATIGLPGGLSVTDADGELSVVGVTITSGTVAVPSNWGSLVPAIPADGVLIPFMSSTALGVPLGALAGDGAPLVAPAGWDLTTTVSFTATPGPAAVISTSGAPTTGAGSLSMQGNAIGAGATSLELSATGLVTLGPLDVPIAGTLSTASASAATVSTVSGAVEERPIATDLTVDTLEVDWSPGSASGSLALVVGSADGSVRLAATAEFPASSSTSQEVTLTVASGSSTWAPAGTSGPQLDLAGSGSVDGDQLDLSLRAPATASWSPARATTITDLSASFDADCSLSATVACRPTVGLDGTVDARPVAAAPVALRGSLDVDRGVTTLRARPDGLGVAPVRVDDTRWRARLSPQGTKVLATGTAQVLGAAHAATVHFAADVVVAEVAMGDRTLVPGWTVDDAVALAADVTTSYDVDASGTVGPVDVVAGRLVGAGATQLPSDLADGVLPESFRSGLVTFAIDGADAGPYRLQLDDPDGWDVTPEAADLASVRIDTLDLKIDADGERATVDLAGAAALSVAALEGSGDAAPVPLVLRGSLSTDGGAGVLDATLSSGPWSAPFGFDGLVVSALELALTVTPHATDVSFGGTATLASALVESLGTSAGATYSLGGQLDIATPYLAVDLGSSTGTGPAIDPGGSGLLATDDAQLVLAPSATTVGGQQVPKGVTVDYTLAGETAQQLQVDPADLAVTGTADLGSVSIGGAPMTDVVVDIASASLTGSLTLDADTVAVTGSITSAVAPATNGSVSLSAPSSASITLGGRNLTVTDLQVATTAIIGPGAPAVGLDTEIAAFGDQVSAQLSGSLIDDALGTLTGTVPSATYPLSDGDAITTDLSVRYGAPSGPSPEPDPGWVLTVGTATTASFTAGPWNLVDGAATVALDGQSFTYAASALLPGTGPDGVDLSGTYATGATAGTPGTFSFGTASSATFTLSGFDMVGTATITRTAGKLTASMDVTASLGLLDGDAPVTFTGSLTPGDAPTDPATTSLSGSLTDVSFRSLSGSTASFTVAPATGELADLGGYETKVQFQTSAGDCAFWDGTPLLEGEVYRYYGTTYYTLSADVELSLPEGIAIGAVAGGGQQPIMLSNEAVPGTQPAPGVTLQAGFAGEAFTALGMFAFDPAQCEFSVGGTLILQFTTGSQGSALAQNSQQGPMVQLSDNQFGPGGSLPESIQVVRREFQSHQLAAQLQSDLAAAQSAAANAAEQETLANRVLSSFQQEAATASAQLQVADARLLAARAALTEAQTAAQAAQARAAAGGAQEEVEAASKQVAAATSSVQEATGEQATAQIRAQIYSDMVELSSSKLATATEVVTTAEEEVADVQEQQQENQAQQHASPFMLTLDWTHCRTCTQVDTFDIDGELLLFGTYIVGVDLSLGFDSGGLDSFDGALTLGYQKQYTVGSSHFYAQLLLLAEATISVGWESGEGWDQLSVDFQGEAQASVYLNADFFTLSATLAEVLVQGGFSFLPTPATFTGSLTVDVFGYEPTWSIGPDEM